MTEQRVNYVTQAEPKRAILETHARSGFVRVLDPDTGRFLFEFDPQRDLIIWRERGKRVEVKLAEYR